MKLRSLFFLALLSLTFAACDDDDNEPRLDIPTSYISANFADNVTAEDAVVGQLSAMTSAANAAESDAQSTPVAPIEYPSTLQSVTLPSYRTLVTDWLVELVRSANSPTGFQNPGLNGTPADGEEGGLLGSRLLDENGLELEQMVQKGSFGAALYNHALTVINGDLSSSAAIDKLVEIHGTEITFDPAKTTAAATYSRRRSDLDNETGFFYDIRDNLITAKAAIEGGEAFEEERDEALANYLLAWEKSNFATVIYYCNATVNQLQAAASITDETERNAALGNALHAYAEGVAFAHGFRGISQKQITDAQIDNILNKLLAPAGQIPTSHRFLNEASLLTNLTELISDIQAIYGFTQDEVEFFFENSNP
ncbi:MAG: hypothetical protein AAF798_03285 [Bacteroidota bacterium]